VDDGVGGTLATAVVDLAERLRRRGVDVPTSAVIDALQGLAAVDLGEREQVRTALRCTLVKRAEDQAAFEGAFVQWTSAVGRMPATPAIDDDRAPAPTLPAPDSPAPVPSENDDTTIRSDLQAALSAGPGAGELEALAARAVARWAGLGKVAGSERYHQQRVLRALGLSDLAHDAVRARGDESARPLVDALVEELRQLVAEEIHARMDDGTRRDPRSRRLGESTGEVRDVDFLRASPHELQQMKALVRPLARKLAARLAQQHRRTRHGRVNMRQTMRASLETGGVPIDPVHRRRRRSKPELWVLCDVSGSVADFARFTLAFVCALHEEFAGLRTFVFVDDVEEITDLLDRRIHDVDPFHLLVRASAERSRHQSDYGRVFERFLEQHGSELSGRATVILAGDGRSHASDPGAGHLRAIRHRSRRLWFLDPEPRSRWSEGDSAAHTYAEICDRFLEVRSMAQLADAVDQLLA
jgi:uncharacterized protein with von Willebrand factor type A (vWA) domain